MSLFKDLFISYGRRESLGFVARLHQQLRLAGYDAWFDKVNIPDGEDYAARINHGIESAHNFVYVMAPRALCSPYCLIEIEYARVLGKRVIPVNQMVIFQADDRQLSEGDKQVLHGFYAAHGIEDPNIETVQQVLDRSLAVVGRTDWLDGKEKVTDEDCGALAQWAQGYENHWYRHEDLDYLGSTELPQFGHSVDELASVVERIETVLERHRTYVEKHTAILGQALAWSRNQYANHYLLVSKERQAAEAWLLTEFAAGEQAPCEPTALMCEFLCASRKNAENLMTDCFICYGVEDKAIRDQLINLLSRYLITTWCHDADIQKGADYARAIEEGIENADNVLYLVSPEAAHSEYCNKELAHALRYHKRIIPVLLRDTPEAEVLPEIRGLQYTDFTRHDTPQDYEQVMDEILYILRQDREYYEQHKMLLSRALKWVAEDRKDSFLMRGYNLDNAKTWLRLNDQREQHPPTDLHRELITTSEAARGQLSTEVFLSYSRKDGDFARELNRALQGAGKTTWFDQESISTGVDFEKEIYKGIDGADNFVFVISPDAVESEYCESEANYAEAQGKRIITLLCRPVDPGTMPEVLRVINWIDFATTPFSKGFAELIQALDLDREHARQHTVFQQRATEWQENTRSQDFLLNATACAKAETWLDQALDAGKKPAPTTLQTDYIHASQAKLEELARKEKRRIAVLSVLLVMAVIAGIFAAYESVRASKQAEIARAAERQAETERDKARDNEIWAKSLTLTTYAKKSMADGRPNDAALLAIAALTRPGAKPDPSYAVTAESALYEAAMQLEKLRLLVRAHENGVNSVCHTADGQYLVSAADDRTLRVWNFRSGELQRTLHGHGNEILQVACAGKGEQIASASSDKTVRLWNVRTGEQTLLLEGHGDAVAGIAYNPDSTELVSASYDKTLRRWNSETGELLGILEGHEDMVFKADYTSDGQHIISASADKTARIWETASGEQQQVLEGHKDWVMHAVYSPDHRQIATASWDDTVRLWDAESGKVKMVLAGNGGGFNSVAYSPNGHYLTAAGHNNTISLWLLDKNRFQIILSGHEKPVWWVMFSADGDSLISASVDGTLRVWDTHAITGNLLGVHNHEVRNAVYSPDGHLIASAALDGKLRLWDSAEGNPHREWQATKAIEGAAFSPDGSRVAAACEDGSVYILTVADLQLQLTLHGHQAGVRAVAYSPDGSRIVSGSKDHTLRLWDAATGAAQKVMRGHTDEVWSVAFHPAGTTVVSASRDYTVRTWDTRSGEQQHLLQGHSYYVNSAVFNPAGTQILSAGHDNTIRIWDAASGAQLQILQGHNNYINSAMYSPDGKNIVSASHDNTLMLWDATTGRPENRLVLRDHDSAVYSVHFSPDARFIVSAAGDKTVRQWEFFPTRNALVSHTREHLWEKDFSETAQKQWELERLLDTGGRSK